MHFGYWICVKEILTFFCGYLGDSEDVGSGSGVLQRSHLSKLHTYSVIQTLKIP